ncbi:MAG: c-type cytochrome [Deltaproteobacteria bacterium]|nr:c-type cytochrome [Deltaproteobacteria bacterium]
MKQNKLLIIFSFIFCLLLFGLSDALAKSSPAGKSIFKTKGCSSCHRRKGPSVDKEFSDLQKKKGPDLWFAGSKFKAGFLATWLANPVPIRPMKFYSLREESVRDHPKLEKEDAVSVAKFLMTLKSKKVKLGVVKAKKSASGRIIFEKKQGCYGCHKFKKGRNVIGGLSGPTLIGVGSRLNPDWIYAFLKNPKDFHPVGAMPIYKGILSEADMLTLSRYLATFK